MTTKNRFTKDNVRLATIGLISNKIRTLFAEKYKNRMKNTSRYTQ